MTTSQAIHRPTRFERPGRRFLAVFLGAIVAVAAIVAILNQITFHFVAKPENRQMAQLVSGWDRTLKPLLYDSTKPQIAAFGASWVRDAFDPVLIDRMTGETFFNFGVSGGTSYEAKRFLDSALASSPPREVFLNLDFFFDTPVATRARFGFNEALLHTRENGEPNPWAGLQRAYALTFSGASLGYNYRIFTTMFEAWRGGAPESVLPAYEQLDFADWRPEMQALRARILGGERPSQVARFPQQRRSGSGTLETLRQTVETLRARGIGVHAYFTPHHMLYYACSKDVESEMNILALLKQEATRGSGSLTYHVFAYPNAVTLEGVTEEASLSRFYRPDGHPRPTVGELMAARMLGQPFPEGSMPDGIDFGADLMTMSEGEARAWLEERKARCGVEWSAGALEQLRRQQP